MRFPSHEFQPGLRLPLEVREETVGNRPRPCRMAYISDIHLRRGRSELLSLQVLDAVRRARPDVILLGGDLVDQVSETGALQNLIGRLVAAAPVLAIPGNHDFAVGEALVRNAVESAGGMWIDGRTESFAHEGRLIAISGPGAAASARADVKVLCAHNPRVWKEAFRQGFDLVLAGHLHGCQWVWFEAGGRLYPGAFFYPHNHLRQRENGSTLVVSRGCSDLIPLRWGCPREIVLCTV